jgi:hypothetical protein
MAAELAKNAEVILKHFSYRPPNGLRQVYAGWRQTGKCTTPRLPDNKTQINSHRPQVSYEILRVYKQCGMDADRSTPPLGKLPVSIPSS